MLWFYLFICLCLFLVRTGKLIFFNPLGEEQCRLTQVRLVSQLHIWNGEILQLSSWHRRSFLLKQILKPSLPSRVCSGQHTLQISVPPFCSFSLLYMNMSRHNKSALWPSAEPPRWSLSEPKAKERQTAAPGALRRSEFNSSQFYLYSIFLSFFFFFLYNISNGPTSCRSFGFSHPCS